MITRPPVSRRRLFSIIGPQMNDPAIITLKFQGWLTGLLRPPARHKKSITHILTRRASVKDVIESFGVPHTEIGTLRVNGKEVPFGHIVQDRDRIEAAPLVPPVDVTRPTVLRPTPLPGPRFMADANVGKLAALLRMAGIDTASGNHWSDRHLALVSRQEQRILLTKDMQLLKYKIVDHGHLVRETEPLRQLDEIVSWYGLGGKLVPFSRCMRCNTILAPVAKEEIVHRLEPLTRKYYHIFHRCGRCDKIYWPGSHKKKMTEHLETIEAWRQEN